MDDGSEPEEGARRRPSIEKTRAPFVEDREPPFERLPDEIIEQILEAADPNGFSSLVVLNRKWREVSQRAYLYRHHLAQCPSYAARSGSLPPSLPPAEEQNLPRLRRLFSQQVKRSLFEPYIRPTRTLVKLVSNSISSSSCPGGEGFSFSSSLRGHHVLAYNSSRIHVLDARGPGLEVRRELKILRRPTSVCITDDASLLAIFSTDMQIDLYDLKVCPPKRKQSIMLDSNPRTIALSSCGSVLAAAYEGGIEVSAIGPGALPSEKRSVKCDAVDALTFSFDGTQILGTTLHSSPPSTVVITAPYYDPGALMSDENLSSMWTTSILFPNSSRDCSHAGLLQDGHEEAAWAFAYDRSFEAFRAVRIDDLRNGTTYFTGPVPNSQAQLLLLPSTLPSATYNAELVAAAFHGSEVWIYGIPEDPAAVPERDSSSSTEGTSLGLTSGLNRGSSSRSSSRPSLTRPHDDAATGRAPQWQMVCDRGRNHIVAGQKVSDIPGVTSAKWVANLGNGSTLKERLLVTARGISGRPRLVTEEEDFDYVDGGRVLLLDFDYGITNGTETEVTIELGVHDAEVLEEEKRDIETEVALARRRTVLQRRGRGREAAASRSAGSTSRCLLLRAATSTEALRAAQQSQGQGEGGAANDRDNHDDNDNDNDDDDPLVPRTLGRNPAQVEREPRGGVSEEELAAALIEAQEALDAPYAHSSPRSGTTLRRAATAAAINRRLNPRTADGRPIEHRRADGRREHPHESDADNWVPPPPPYQAEDPGAVPAFLRGPAVTVAPSTTPLNSTASLVQQVQQVQQVQHDVSPPESPQATSPQHETEFPSPVAAAGSLPTVSVESPHASSESIPREHRPSSTTSPRGGPAGSGTPSRRLSNAATWPRAHGPTPTPSPRPTPTSRLRSSSPPAPQTHSRQRQRQPPPSPQLEIEQPLIISTPAGVTGAFDPPGRRISRRAETPILAPVPQRPRADNAGAGAPPRSAVDRLETIFSSAKAPEQVPPNDNNSNSNSNSNNKQKKKSSSSSSSLLPGWMGGRPAVSPGRSASIVNRRPSRAGRSAAKNMSDARKRGFNNNNNNNNIRSKSQKRKKKKKRGDCGSVSNEGETMLERGRAGGWMDVPASPIVERERKKELKCVVM